MKNDSKIDLPNGWVLEFDVVYKDSYGDWVSYKNPIFNKSELNNFKTKLHQYFNELYQIFSINEMIVFEERVYIVVTKIVDLDNKIIDLQFSS